MLSNTPAQPIRPSQAKPRPRLARMLEVIIDLCLYGAVFTIPLIFTTLTVDYVELPKQTLLIAFALIALTTWVARAVSLQSFELRRNWLHVVTVIVLFGFGGLSFFSVDHYLSFVGALGQMTWSFATLAAILGLYLVAVNRIRAISQVYNLLFTALVSSFFVGLYGIFQLQGWFILPVSVSQSNTFTSVGSVFGLSVYMVVPLIISAGLAYHGCRNNVCFLGSRGLFGYAARILLWLTMVVSLLVLLLVDYWVAWAALIFGMSLLVLLGVLRGLNVGHPAKHSIPALLVIVSVMLIIYPTPLKVSLPSEIAPSASASWDIAKQTLRDLPLAGSGPSTWIYDYARYRNPLVNASPFWNVRFDRGFSQFFTLIATTGIIGMSLWLILIVSVIVKSVSHVLRERNEDVWYAYVGAFTAWSTLTFVSFFYNYSISHLLLWGVLLALLGAMSGGSVWQWNAKKHKFALEGIVTILVIVMVGGVSGLWLVGQRFVADASFAHASESFRSGQPIDDIIESIQQAQRLNPYVDMYTRNLSQAHLIKAAQIIRADPSEADAAVAQQEIKNAIDEGMAASSTNPGNVENFSNLAVLYQSIAQFTNGADEFAILSYREALKREPNNPVFIAEIGKLYLLRADTYRSLLDSEDQAVRQDAVSQMEVSLQAAEDILHRAVEAKGDYLPARYYLGVVYERENKLKEAITELANVLQIDKSDVGVEFELSILLYRDGQKELATNAMEDVVNTDPSNLNAKWYLAAMYEEFGRVDEAITLIEDLAGRFPDNTTVQQRLEGLWQAKNVGSTNVGLPEPVIEPIRNATDGNPVSN